MVLGRRELIFAVGRVLYSSGLSWARYSVPVRFVLLVVLRRVEVIPDE